MRGSEGSASFTCTKTMTQHRRGTEPSTWTERFWASKVGNAACVSALLILGVLGVLMRDMSGVAQVMSGVAAGRRLRFGLGDENEDDDDYRKLHRIEKRRVLPYELVDSSSESSGRADTGEVIKLVGSDESKAAQAGKVDIQPFENLANLGNEYNASAPKDESEPRKSLGLSNYRSVRKHVTSDPHVFGGHWGKQASLLVDQLREQKLLCESLQVDVDSVRKDFEGAYSTARNGRQKLDDILIMTSPPPPPTPLEPKTYLGSLPPDAPPPLQPPPPTLDEEDKLEDPAAAIAAVRRAKEEHESNMKMYKRLSNTLGTIQDIGQRIETELNVLQENEVLVLEKRSQCGDMLKDTYTRILSLMKQMQNAIEDTETLLSWAMDNFRVGPLDVEMELLEKSKSMVPARAMAIVQASMSRSDEREKIISAVNATVFRVRSRIDSIGNFSAGLDQFADSFHKYSSLVGDEQRALAKARKELPELKHTVHKQRPHLLSVDREGPYIDQLESIISSMENQWKAAQSLRDMEDQASTIDDPALDLHLDKEKIPYYDAVLQEQLDTIAMKLKPLREARSRLLSVEEAVDALNSYTVDPIQASISEAKTILSTIGLQFDDLCGEATVQNGRHEGELRKVLKSIDDYMLEKGSEELLVQPIGVSIENLTQLGTKAKNARPSIVDNKFSFSTRTRPPPAPERPPPPSIDPAMFALERTAKIKDLPTPSPPAFKASFDRLKDSPSNS